MADTFWTAIREQLAELRTAKSADDVLRTLSPERNPYGSEWDGMDGAAQGFFAGSSVVDTVWDALDDAGWETVWDESALYYVMRAPDGSTVTYCEGDVYRGITAHAARRINEHTNTWSTSEGHPATGTRLQSAEIGANTYWRVVAHDYATGTDTPVMGPEFHERNAVAAYRWHIGAHERAERVAALRSRITAGWTVDITNHDYIADSHDGALVERITDDGALIIKPRKGWSSQGRGFGFTRLTWDGEMDADGDTLHVWTIPTGVTSRSTPGVPHRVKSYRFHPPRAH